jgi:hypothetical protein
VEEESKNSWLARRGLALYWILMGVVLFRSEKVNLQLPWNTACSIHQLRLSRYELGNLSVDARSPGGKGDLSRSCCALLSTGSPSSDSSGCQQFKKKSKKKIHKVVRPAVLVLVFVSSLFEAQDPCIGPPCLGRHSANLSYFYYASATRSFFMSRPPQTCCDCTTVATRRKEELLFSKQHRRRSEDETRVLSKVFT